LERVILVRPPELARCCLSGIALTLRARSSSQNSTTFAALRAISEKLAIAACYGRRRSQSLATYGAKTGLPHPCFHLLLRPRSRWRAKSLTPSRERDRSSLNICLLKIDSQSASHVVICAGLRAVALARGIVSPERRLRRTFGAGAPGQRCSCCDHDQDAEHT